MKNYGEFIAESTTFTPIYAIVDLIAQMAKLYLKSHSL